MRVLSGWQGGDVKPNSSSSQSLDNLAQYLPSSKSTGLSSKDNRVSLHTYTSVINCSLWWYQFSVQINGFMSLQGITLVKKMSSHYFSEAIRIFYIQWKFLTNTCQKNWLKCHWKKNHWIAIVKNKLTKYKQKGCQTLMQFSEVFL